MRQVDASWLERWIRSAHLDRESLCRYRDRYERGPIPIVSIADFLQPDVFDDLHEFLSVGAEFDLVRHVYGVDGYADDEQWASADDRQRWGHYSRLSRAVPGRSSFAPLTYAMVHDAFGDERFIRFFENLTGTALGSLVSFEGKSFGTGDFLGEHNDKGEDRRIAFIVYLSPEWRAEDGGALVVRTEEGVTERFAAISNTLVVFDVRGHKRHFIEPVTPGTPDMRRLSIGGWYTDAAAQSAG